MASEETTTPEASAAPVASKVPKSITRTLVNGNEQMLFIGTIRNNGTVGLFVNHRILKEDGKLEKSTRGATSEHANVAAALKAISGGIALAVKKGWQERKAGASAGFRARPDAFGIDSLPSPSGLKK